MPRPSIAPINVFRKFMNSLVAQGYSSFCRLAPKRLSMFVAMKAAIMTTGTELHFIRPRPTPASAMMMEPPTPAKVPSKLTAPSVPLGTGLNVVIKKVRFPKAFPISLAKVSDNLVDRDDT